MKPEEIKSELEKLGSSLKEAGEKAIAESAKGVAMSAKTKEIVDELLTKQGELLTEQKEMAVHIEELQKKAARMGTEDEGQKTLGQLFVESDAMGELRTMKGKGKAVFNTKTINTITSLTTGTGAAGSNVRPDRVISPLMMPGVRRLTIRDLIAAGRTASNSVEYVQETGFQNGAGIQVNEGDAKPQSDITFALTTAPVATLATFVKASKQILNDAPMLQSYIDTRITYGLKLVEENQLLMGAGTGGNIDGIYTQATAFSKPTGGYPASNTVGETVIDVLRLALLQAELAFYPSDGIVLNPTNWGAIELLKDTQGRYIIGNPQGNISPTLWGRDVVSTQAMTVSKFLVGSFGLAAQVFDREDAAVYVSTEDSDNFQRNLVTILAEERLALCVYRPEAFIKGDVTSIT